MAFIRKIGFLRGSTRDLCLSDSNLVSANTTTDTDFTQTIGRKADTALTAVGTTGSLVALCKYIANLLNGTRAGIGQLLTLVAAGVVAKTSPGSGVGNGTILTATGTVFVKAVHLKKLTTDEASVTSLTLVTNDTVPLNLLLRKEDGTELVAADFTASTSWTFLVGWQIATTKVLQLKSGGSNGQAAGYQVHVEAYAVTENASIA